MQKETKVDMAAKATEAEQQKILQASFSDEWKSTEERSCINDYNILAASSNMIDRRLDQVFDLTPSRKQAARGQ